MRLANLDNLADRGDVAVHRVDGFKGHDLGPVADGVQFAVKVAPVVVLPQDLVGAGMADAFDHRGVVLFVRQDHRVRDLAAEGRQRRPVRDVARGEEQSAFLAVQVGKFLFQKDVVVGRARDVAGAARAGAAGLYCVHHRGHDVRVLAHAEVVVGTPDRHLFLGAIRPVAFGLGEAAAAFLQIGEDAVVAFGFQGLDAVLEIGGKVHGTASCQVSCFVAWAVGASGSIQRQSFWSGIGSTMKRCSIKARAVRTASRR